MIYKGEPLLVTESARAAGMATENKRLREKVNSLEKQIQGAYVHSHYNTIQQRLLLGDMRKRERQQRSFHSYWLFGFPYNGCIPRSLSFQCILKEELILVCTSIRLTWSL